MDTTVDRVKSLGVGAAHSIDLIAVGFSRRESDAVQGEEMAREMLKRCHPFSRIAELGIADILATTGLEGFEAMRALALIELGRRSAGSAKGDLDPVERPEDVADLLPHLKAEKREHVCVLLLDAQNRLIRWANVHVGTLTMSVVGPREVFREAIREGASAIILAHNHPSGDPSPSPEDIEVTAKIAEVGKMLDIPLLDHVIIGDRNRTVSLKQRGQIK